MLEHAISVEVFGVEPISSGGGCGPGCGCHSQPSLVQFVDAMRRVLQRRFGERVTVSYCDLLSPEALRRPEIVKEIREQNLSLPVVALDGRLKFAGRFSVASIINALETMATPTTGAGGIR